VLPSRSLRDELCIFVADMALAVCTMASFHIDFNKYERELFLTCYATRIANALQSLRLLKGMEEIEGANNSFLKVIKDYILETESYWKRSVMMR
jgi:hypothetical protein